MMTDLPEAQARTGLSPEWDRGFDDAFTDLICSDDDLVRSEFDALIRASWRPPSPSPPAVGSPAGPGPSDPGPGRGPAERRSGEPDDIASDDARPP